MTARRRFLQAASLASAALAVPAARAAEKSGLPSGKLCILVYGKSRTKLPAGQASSIVVVDLPSFEVRRIASPVTNLHGLFVAGPNASQFWGIGHESAERMDVFDRQFNRLETRSYPDIRFRGHGMAWKGGLLVSAERMTDPLAGGLLLHLDAQGKVVEQYPSGGLRPHDIAVCGDFFAVAHYGNRPLNGPGATAPMNGAPPPMLFDLVVPGVAFLRRDTLEVAAFHELPGNVAISHLGATANGHAMAMGLNTQRVPGEQALYELAERDGATLLPSELYERGYEVHAPMYRIDPRQGVVQTLREPASRMRRGQSFSYDARTGLVVATYAASQTLYVQRPGQPDRFLSTLEFGVPNPRGCAVLPGTTLVAVSGNDDNVALIDVTAGRLEKLVGVPTGGHSHMFWMAD